MGHVRLKARGQGQVSVETVRSPLRKLPNASRLVQEPSERTVSEGLIYPVLVCCRQTVGGGHCITAATVCGNLSDIFGTSFFFFQAGDATDERVSLTGSSLTGFGRGGEGRFRKKGHGSSRCSRR